MSWKPSAKSSEHLRAKLDDEFETVASRKACAAAPTRAAPPSPPPRRTNGSARPSSARRRAPDPGGSRGRPRRCAGRRWSGQRSDGPRQEGGRCAGRWRQARAQGAVAEDARRGLSVAPRACARRIGPQAGASCRRSGRDRGGAGRAGKEGWLSTERFAQSLVHRRASRQGARIVQELRQHGVDDGQVAELRDQLRSTEHERALEVWRKRFGESRPTARPMPSRRASWPAAASRRMSSAAYWAARATKSRPGRRVGPGPQTPGPKRQVSSARSQAPSFRPQAPGVLRATIATLTARSRGPSPPPRLFRRLDPAQRLEADVARDGQEFIDVRGVCVLAAHRGVERAPYPCGPSRHCRSQPWFMYSVSAQFGSAATPRLLATSCAMMG